MCVAALSVKCRFFTQLGATGADSIGEVLGSKREAEKKDEQAGTEEQLIGAAKIRAVATTLVQPSRHSCETSQVKAWLSFSSWARFFKAQLG